MDYDAVIIGAGMSGLAAGIRLAYFGRRVCILEKHYAFGGLNSYYKLDGREYDVGLHAVTNYVPPGIRSTPLPKLLRQLRLTREDFDLCEQGHSEIRFPDKRLRFTNDLSVLTGEVAENFAGDADGFCRLVTEIQGYEDTKLDEPYRSTREILRTYLRDPLLIEMLLCPVMYYGSAEPEDMDFAQFCTMFKSLFCEGFARPRDGVRTIVKALVRKFRTCGGKIRMNCGVQRVEIANGKVAALVLENGERLTADVVFSCAGFHETMQMCSEQPASVAAVDKGEISFVETIFILDRLPADFGHHATIVFFNHGESFVYRRPHGGEPVDERSGVVCCPNNYKSHEHLREGIFRLTWLADYQAWMGYDEETYRRTKRTYLARALDEAERYLPGMRNHVVVHDMFTPRTIKRYTGHLNGAVYGVPRKIRDGRTPFDNLFICGTDQGFLGIIGAMLSGITMANLHVLSVD
ncbi:MAG: NAD(P)/FAD-dependent oxidoreductase [Planctomycetes bacterium]|nr:NAD(P)/FAD-dependent oxidoreductase [Planctomycetota bacterium]